MNGLWWEIRKPLGWILTPNINDLFQKGCVLIYCKSSIESPSCIFVGFVIQYAHMSALFWLSAIGYNVWNSFRKPDGQGSKTNKLGIYDKKYKWYALYSWGCPLVMTIVTLIMQNVSVGKDIVTPKIGFRTCSLEPEAALFFYFHLINIPVMVSTT